MSRGRWLRFWSAHGPHARPRRGRRAGAEAQPRVVLQRERGSVIEVAPEAVLSGARVRTLRAEAQIRIGRAARLAGAVVEAATLVVVGDHVRADGARISDVEGEAGSASAIFIADHVELGPGVVVCGGVTIGRGARVRANARVERDLPAWSVCEGSPATVVGRLSFEEREARR